MDFFIKNKKIKIDLIMLDLSNNLITSCIQKNNYFFYWRNNKKKLHALFYCYWEEIVWELYGPNGWVVKGTTHYPNSCNQNIFIRISSKSNQWPLIGVSSLSIYQRQVMSVTVNCEMVKPQKNKTAEVLITKKKEAFCPILCLQYSLGLSNNENWQWS